MKTEDMEKKIEKLHNLCVELASIVAAPIILARINNNEHALPHKEVFDSISNNIKTICFDMINQDYVQSECISCGSLGVIPKERENFVNVCPKCKGE